VDRRVRQQEEERHRANFLVQIEALSAKVVQLEGALRDATRDYVQGKRRLVWPCVCRRPLSVAVLGA
jgi:hypothetical protein